MKYLLDTHALLWFLAGDTQLSDRARTSIEDPNNEVFLSIVSLWETAVKVSLARVSHEFRRVHMQGARREGVLGHVECRATQPSARLFPFERRSLRA